jgi:hypothetical protein
VQPGAADALCGGEQGMSKKVEVDGSDPVFIALAVFFAITDSPWWLVAIPLIAASWVINPRWSKSEGWRFWL